MTGTQPENVGVRLANEAMQRLSKERDAYIAALDAPTTPDTRPRCGDLMAADSPLVCELAPDHSGPHEWNNQHEGYRWPNRAAPDTQSGGRPTDDVESAVNMAQTTIGLLRSCVLAGESLSAADHTLISASLEGLKAIPAALQEARDDAAYWHGKAMEYANRATAAEGERARAEAAEAENVTLRERAFEALTGLICGSADAPPGWVVTAGAGFSCSYCHKRDSDTRPTPDAVRALAHALDCPVLLGTRLYLDALNSLTQEPTSTAAESTIAGLRERLEEHCFRCGEADEHDVHKGRTLIKAMSVWGTEPIAPHEYLSCAEALKQFDQLGEQVEGLRAAFAPLVTLDFDGGCRGCGSIPRLCYPNCEDGIARRALEALAPAAPGDGALPPDALTNEEPNCGCGHAETWHLVAGKTNATGPKVMPEGQPYCIRCSPPQSRHPFTPAPPDAPTNGGEV